ncbi:MAG TPA: acyl-CoA dehydrogenase, partial [Caulobacteraceae bacterium]|nr:acyl-CoA dehydrogenase [Caulobacteraceae bacterium]
VMGIADGPTEVHKVTVAKQILKDYTPSNELFPDYHLPRKRAAAQERFAEDLKALKAERETA